MLPPLKVHQVIQEKAKVKSPVILIEDLAEELKVGTDALEEPLRILEYMRMVEIDARERSLALTPSGKLANLHVQPFR